MAKNESEIDSAGSPCYSPGPWFVHHNGSGAFCIKTGEDYDTSPTIASRSKWERIAAESDANGYLIAAAPDLLEAVEAMLEEYEDGRNIQPYEIREMCRKAKFKAYGESYE